MNSARRALEKNLSAKRVKLDRQPCAARVFDGDLDSAAQRLRERRERAAFEAGRESAVKEAVMRLDAVTAQLRDSNQHVNDTLASDSVELALAIAAELVRCQVENQRHDIEALVRDALSASGVGRGACTVHVSPEDARMLATVPFRSGTRIEADPDVQRACVQIETPQGLLVRDIESALASVAARLREEART